MRKPSPATEDAAGHLPGGSARLSNLKHALRGPVGASLLVLVAANGVILWGVLARAWDVFPVIFLFWLENVVIGVLNVARMTLARPRDAGRWVQKVFLIPFFCVHYGMFTLIHGMFVIAFFGGMSLASSGRHVDLFAEPAILLWVLDSLDLWIPATVLAASHAFSFVWNYVLHREYRGAEVQKLMSKPYGRVVVLHLTIIAGGALALTLGSPLWALLFLLGLKTAVDAVAHYREHRDTDTDAGRGAPGTAETR